MQLKLSNLIPKYNLFNCIFKIKLSPVVLFYVLYIVQHDILSNPKLNGSTSTIKLGYSHFF